MMDTSVGQNVFKVLGLSTHQNTNWFFLAIKLGIYKKSGLAFIWLIVEFTLMFTCTVRWLRNGWVKTVRRVMNVDLKFVIMLYVHSANTGGGVKSGPCRSQLVSWACWKKSRGFSIRLVSVCKAVGRRWSHSKVQHDVDIKLHSKHKQIVKSCHLKNQSGNVTDWVE